MDAKRLEQGLDASFKIALNLRYYQATTAVLLWASVVEIWAGALSWRWGIPVLVLAIVAGHINRWDERGKQAEARRGN